MDSERTLVAVVRVVDRLSLAELTQQGRGSLLPGEDLTAGWALEIRRWVVVLRRKQIGPTSGAAQGLRRRVARLPGHSGSRRCQVDGDGLAFGTTEGGPAVPVAQVAPALVDEDGGAEELKASAAAARWADQVAPRCGCQCLSLPRR